jgi:hypothetical protein
MTKEETKEYNRLYYINNKENIKIQTQQYYTNNKEIVNKRNREYSKNHYKANPERYKIYMTERYKNDPQTKLSLLLRVRLNNALKQIDKSDKSFNLLGCTIEEYKQYLETQFKPEMNWDNHGLVWEIDHIIPCSLFDLTDIEQQKQCFYYTNLQPLFKTTEIAESFGYNELGNRNKSDN